VINQKKTQTKPFPTHLLVNAVYEGAQYWGEHAAHIAVVVFGDEPKYLKQLIDCGADVSKPRAQGIFFNRDHGSVYMGETVLHFAAYMGHSKIVEYLISECDVDPNQLDSYGNNVLHILAHAGFYGVQRPWTAGKDAAEEEETNEDAGEDDHGNGPVIEEEGLYFKFARGGFVSKKEVKSGMEEAADESSSSSSLSSSKPVVFNNMIADDTVANSDGMTPFIVAVEVGQVKMVRALLDFKSKLIWKYGKASKKSISLSELDTYIESQTMNHNVSALEVAVKQHKSGSAGFLDTTPTTKKYMNILSLSVFEKLLDSKWKLYARRILYFRFFSNLLYMIMFSIMIGLLPNGIEFFGNPPHSSALREIRLPYLNTFRHIFLDRTLYEHPQDTLSVVRFVLEVTLIVLNVRAMMREVKELMSGGIKEYVTGFGCIENIFQSITISTFTVGWVSRFCGWWDIENMFLGFSAIVGWIYLLYFSKASQDLGPLCIIFFKMLTTDLVRFLWLVSIFMIGFGEAIWLKMVPFGSEIILKNANKTDGVDIGEAPFSGYAEWSNLFPGALVWTLRLFFGQGSYDDFRKSQSTFTLVLFVSFLLCVNILLINIFIAMLSQTFNEIYSSEVAIKQWRMLWADLIMEIDKKILQRHKEAVKRAKKRGEDVSEIPMPITRVGVTKPADIVKPIKWVVLQSLAQSEKPKVGGGGGGGGGDANNEKNKDATNKDATKKDEEDDKRNLCDYVSTTKSLFFFFFF
jgi:ankyrin repeat protein